MFTGIVTTIGTINHIDVNNGCKQFVICPATKFEDLTLGESIAVNGVCLTVTDFNTETFCVTAVPETLRLTNLDLLNTKSEVNLERALTLNTRLGGHYVQGHVDAMGEIIDITTDASAALLVMISIPATLGNYIVSKGYITIDGMSITVIAAMPTCFTVTFIPHTQAVTTIKHYRKGTQVNIEVDIMGKYIEKLMRSYTHAQSN